MSDYIELMLDKVTPGMFIEFELAWLKNPFYSNSFRVSSTGEIETLAKAGVRKVRYFPSRSVAPRPESTPHPFKPPVRYHQSEVYSTEVAQSQKRLQFQELQKRQARLELLEREYKTVFTRISNVVRILQSDIQTGVEATQEFLSDTIKSLADEMELLVHMVTSEMTKDNINSLHQLNVCYLSLLLGKAMGLSQMQLYELGAAAFLHDIGKLKIPRQILLKLPPYTPAEKHYLELHPQYGVEILSPVKSISKNVIDAIFQHHEMCNGTGYPQKKTSQSISLMAKIVTVVNTYDNLCNHYYLKRLLTPHESLSYMYTRLKESLSMDIVMTFIKTVGVYPSGCLVELSDGNLGIVISSRQDQSTQPTIIIYDSSVPREKPLIVNLGDVEGLTIVRSIRPTEAPPDIVSYLQMGNRSGLSLGYLVKK